MTLRPQEIFQIMTGNQAWCGIDVRSESEFIEGHWSGIKNTPILNNQHRHLVGTAYKQQGQAVAIELGLNLTGPIKSELLISWRNDLEKVDAEKRFITCWRGGMRSKFSQNWLKELGFEVPRIDGGVKALRRFSLELLAKGPREIILLGGMTGNGKTALLRELDLENVIDLEAIANHRGSSFGGHIESPQPAQSTFENDLAIEFYKKPKQVLMEAESRLVGQCVIPENIKRRMDVANIIVLDSSMEERIERLLKEYVLDPIHCHGEDKVIKSLKSNLLKIQKKLGGLQTQVIMKKLEAREYRAWIEDLLIHYYDKLYNHSLNTKDRTVVFRGDKKAVKDYLLKTIIV